jgi:hypothetical protein
MIYPVSKVTKCTRQHILGGFRWLPEDCPVDNRMYPSRRSLAYTCDVSFVGSKEPLCFAAEFGLL